MPHSRRPNKSLFITILIMSILYGAEVDLFIPSFPEIQTYFNLNPFLVQLTLSANYVPYAICSLFAGTLGDRYNRRVVLLYSLGVFVLGSLCCVLAENYSLLILGRFLQGIGIAFPAVLEYVIISDAYPLDEQISMLGLLNGIVTISMAFAPVIGSYINLWFNWRANFILLLGFGIISLLTSYLYIPSHEGDRTVSLSPKSYMPVLRSNKVMMFIISLLLPGVAYWLFVGMAPILYMEDLGVELKNFGYYQGSIAMGFGVISLLSPKIIDKFGIKNCLKYSVVACTIIACVNLAVAWLGVASPLVITLVMVMDGMAIVFPVQILFPVAMHFIPNSKGRVSALMNCLRLILTAIALEVVSYYYTGSYMLLGTIVGVLMLIAMFLVLIIMRKNWLQLDGAIINKMA